MSSESPQTVQNNLYSQEVTESATATVYNHHHHKLHYSQTSSSVAEVITANQSNLKWEELIISGRNIQNRSVAAAVVYNHVLYVYGGYDITAGILCDFLRITLDNSTYHWDKVLVKNPVKSPGKLCKQSCVVYKDKMYMLGGQFVGEPLNRPTMFCFDFASSKWDDVIISHSSLDFPSLDSHQAVVYKDSMIVMSGYMSELGRYSEAVYSFDFKSNSWSILSLKTPRPRIGTAIALFNDRIFLFGGFDGSERLNDLHSFDLISHSWTHIAVKGTQIPKTRRGHSLSVHGDKLVVFGGIHDVTWELDDLFVFDINTSCWIEIDRDSARREEYTSETHQSSPTRSQQHQQRRSNFKRYTYAPTNSASKARSIIMQSPTKSISSAFSNSSPRDERYAALSEIKKKQNQAYLNDPYYSKDDELEGRLTNSPKRNLDIQRKKEFFQRKSDMLAMFVNDTDTALNKSKEIGRKQSNSPTSEAMSNALNTIGNPMPELKLKKGGRTTDFGRVTCSKFLQPIASHAHSRVGKKPCARDGHSAVLDGNNLLIFGGDRHRISFNDLFTLHLDQLC